MSLDSQRPLLSQANGKAKKRPALEDLDKELRDAEYMAQYHGDELLADKHVARNTWKSFQWWVDISPAFAPKNLGSVAGVAWGMMKGKGLDAHSGAQLMASLPNHASARADFIAHGVKEKYEKMLHPPLTYLGDAFQYRAADGKFNNVLHPHLGQAGAPYAKTVPSKTHPLGALPDPGDIFDRLMARKPEGRNSASGLSSMLIYHATIIIHDIFRTNDNDKNISDSSSYLDLSPLYGYTEEMTRQIRDGRYKLGLLKPDTFAEDRLVRQPPGVCIMLVMYNRYHNYAATQLRRINENNRFRVPEKYSGPKYAAMAKACVADHKKDEAYRKAVDKYKKAWDVFYDNGQKRKAKLALERAAAALEEVVNQRRSSPPDPTKPSPKNFLKEYDAAWDKLDDDLFNTARLITCGIYINISIHDYLRGLMAFHQFPNTNFTLDPRVDCKGVSRGIGNQVTVEFNLLYRFHCAISQEDEKFTEAFMKEMRVDFLENVYNGTSDAVWDRAKRQEIANSPEVKDWDPKNLSLNDFLILMAGSRKKTKKPWRREFGLKDDEKHRFARNPVTGLFDDEKMISQLLKSMDDPISNFGPCNIPIALKSVELMGIEQARKWECGTLNDFRDFFGMKRHKTFQDISKNTEVQNALRDLYDHPDKVELYPGVFCESDASMSVDPGPSEVDSALWAAIFSDAITLVRSDRFYTVDWNTNSLTSWGMKEVTPDNDVLKSSVFHRLIQRAFPGWFPYDSIRFFHPFYTSAKNAQFAQEQGYAKLFKMQVKDTTRPFARKESFLIDTKASEPVKPPKPLYLTDYADIKAIFEQSPDVIINPIRLESASLPAKVAAVLSSTQLESKPTADEEDSLSSDQSTIDYFSYLVREIIKREKITVNPKEGIYQVDITRDVAIPVITRYVADFLGFSHKIRTTKDSKAPYSENDIYRHITNCQVFLCYNPDETKTLKRRAAFKDSMQFLFELAEAGNIKTANSWVNYFMPGHSDAPMDYMKNLGLRVAGRILAHERDAGRAAAILLLTALDSAYNSVLAFTAVLDKLLTDLYELAENTINGPTKTKKSCTWRSIQKLALQDNAAADYKIKDYVLETQRVSVKLPVVRQAVKARTFSTENGRKFEVAKGQTIICDILMIGKQHAAMAKMTNLTKLTEGDYLNYVSSLSQHFVHFKAKHIAVLGLTAMIKVLAQTKNLRRGHDAQGRLKRVKIDQTNEGYENFMAPMRMKKIKWRVENNEERSEDFDSEIEDLEPERESEKDDSMSEDDFDKTDDTSPAPNDDLGHVYDDRVLKPATETFLTPEWDEMVPFPTTWKVRFDGYGPSSYAHPGKPELSMLVKEKLPDWAQSIPPWYQPRGASHYGGSFADVVCVCNVPGMACKCKEEGSSKGEGGKKQEEVEPVEKEEEKLPADYVEVKLGGCGVPGLP